MIPHLEPVGIYCVGTYGLDEMAHSSQSLTFGRFLHADGFLGSFHAYVSRYFLLSTDLDLLNPQSRSSYLSYQH